jgi:hypothetical protein
MKTDMTTVHWDHTYNIKIDGVDQHRVIIYTQLDDRILLCGGDKFNTAFGRYLDEIDGVWNGTNGWYFSTEDGKQKEVFSLLKRIHTGDVPPILKEFRHTSSEKDMKKMCQKIYGGLDEIFKLIPVEKDSFIISSSEGETIFYFNRSEGDRTKGECVVTLEKNRKKVEIFQYMYV